MNRKTSVCAITVFFLCIGWRAMAQDKVRMGLSSVSGLHTAVWVAETKGLFRKHGIDPEVIVTGQGGKQILLDDPAGNAIELFEPPRRER